MRAMKILAIIGIAFIYLIIGSTSIYFCHEYPSSIGYCLGAMFGVGYIHNMIESWWKKFWSEREIKNTKS